MSVQFLNDIVTSGTPTLTSIAVNTDDIDLQVINEDFDPDEEDSTEYTSIYTIHGKWLFDNTDVIPTVATTDPSRRGNYLLRVLEVSDELAVAMKTATHVPIAGKVYIINRSDSVPPKHLSPYWQIYCDHEFI